MILGVPIDPVRLWESDDRAYVVWLATLLERVQRTHEQGRE